MSGAFLAPTPFRGNGAQGGSKAPPFGGGTGRFFASLRKIPEPPFDATKHRGIESACFSPQL
jgi:hypothetical protein